LCDTYHNITSSSSVYDYDEDSPLSPLTTEDNLYNYIGRNSYLYLANDRDCWGSLQNKLFFCSSSPIDAYLSQNFPGNNARWIATILLAAREKEQDLIVNGNFEDATGWVFNGNWDWSEDYLYAYHTSGSDTQSLDVSAMIVDIDTIYEVIFTISSVTSGNITPTIGGVYGVLVESAGTNIQYIYTATPDVLKFIPSGDFAGVIDTVSCRKVISGGFTGTYIVDSVVQKSVAIDDSIVSTSATWSSAKIQSLENNLRALISGSDVFNTEKNVGLTTLRLNYVNSSEVQLVSTTSSTTVVFPTFTDSIDITPTGISLNVAGSANTLYYIYLSPAGLVLSDDPPNNLYNRLSTYGLNYILVGYIGFSSTNVMDTPLNVYSIYNQLSTTESVNVTGNMNNTWYGIVRPSGITITSQRTSGSSWSGIVDFYGDGGGLIYSGCAGLTLNAFSTGSYNGVYPPSGNCSFASPLPGGSAWAGWVNGIGYCWTVTYYRPTVSVGIALTSSFTGDVVGNYNMQLSHSYSNTNAGYYSNFRWRNTGWSYTGQLVVTRSAGLW
jgi:hypothetical protein